MLSRFEAGKGTESGAAVLIVAPFLCFAAAAADPSLGSNSQGGRSSKLLLRSVEYEARRERRLSLARRAAGVFMMISQPLVVLF